MQGFGDPRSINRLVLILMVTVVIRVSLAIGRSKATKIKLKDSQS